MSQNTGALEQITWANVADVLAITGITATENQLVQAGFIIDLYSGRPYTFTGPDGTVFAWHQNVGDADAYWMKLAVAFEVAWLQQNVDVLTRVDLQNIPAKGRPLTLNANALVLGPLVKKALGRVSWLRSRALHVRSPFEDLYTANSVNFGEFVFPWSPIGGASGPDY